MFIHSERQAYHDTVQYLYARPAKGGVKCLKYVGYIIQIRVSGDSIYKSWNHNTLWPLDMWSTNSIRKLLPKGSK